jgi:xanthine dehydrogenase small subunit
MIEFVLNDQIVRTAKPSGSLLLDYLRYERRLTGTKIGCREGDCGACTVLIGSLERGRMCYRQATSCLLPLGNVHAQHVVTIEGLNLAELSPVQQALVAESGTQCGFCTVGFVVSLMGYCLSADKPDFSKAIAAIDGNICRCTGYKSIERAVARVVQVLADKELDNPIPWLVQQQFIPAYFEEVPIWLTQLEAPLTPMHAGVLVGGGTDLYVQQPDHLHEREVPLVASHPEWRFIRVAEGQCVLGAATTITDMLAAAELHRFFPHLAQHLKLVASSPIRNSATLAGNFVNASPIGDMTAFFLALNAQLTLSTGDQSRTILLRDFYQGYKQLAKTDAEVITTIRFPVPPPNSYFNFEKVSKRIHLDIASVNSAALLTVVDGVLQQAQISAGGVAPVPLYLSQTCAFLKDKPLAPANLQAAQAILQSEISPISDVRGSAAYKRLLLRQLFYAHFITLFPERITLKALQL